MAVRIWHSLQLVKATSCHSLIPAMQENGTCHERGSADLEANITSTARGVLKDSQYLHGRWEYFASETSMQVVVFCQLPSQNPDLQYLTPTLNAECVDNSWCGVRASSRTPTPHLPLTHLLCHINTPFSNPRAAHIKKMTSTRPPTNIQKPCLYGSVSHH
jgi:hypothetical protein